MSPLQENFESANSPEATPAHNFMSSLARKGRKEIFAAGLGLAALSGCVHIRKAIVSIGKPSSSEAYSAISDGNFPLARKYFNNKLCDEAIDRAERCEAGKEKDRCQIAALKVGYCERVRDGIAGTIDSYKKEMNEFAEKRMYYEAIGYIDESLPILDKDEELYKKLIEKRTKYVKEIELAKKRYPAQLTSLKKIVSGLKKGLDERKKQFKKTKKIEGLDWKALQVLIDKLRVDREIIKKSDKELFLQVAKLTKLLYKIGDYQKAQVAVGMSKNVDLGETNFVTETQISSNDKALFGAIDSEIEGARAKTHEIMAMLTPIEKRLDAFDRAKNKSIRLKIAEEIRLNTDKVFLADEKFIRSNRRLHQRVKDIYEFMNPKNSSRRKRAAKRILQQRRMAALAAKAAGRERAEATATQAGKAETSDQSGLNSAEKKQLSKLKKHYAGGRIITAIAGLEAMIAKNGLKTDLMMTRSEWSEQRQRLIKIELDKAYELDAIDDFGAIQHFKKALSLNPDDPGARSEAKGTLEKLERRKARYEKSNGGL